MDDEMEDLEYNDSSNKINDDDDDDNLPDHVERVMPEHMEHVAEASGFAHFT